MSEKTLYDRLGGYEGIIAFVEDLLPRLESDAQLGRFWQHRGDDEPGGSPKRDREGARQCPRHESRLQTRQSSSRSGHDSEEDRRPSRRDPEPGQ